MPTIGTQLSAARKQLGWTVEEVSFNSKIRPSIIESLESDNYSQFSSASYVKSFIRKYAGLLGLDLEMQIQDLVLEEPENSNNYLPQERVKETLESAEFSKKHIRFRKAQRSKGSPLFLIGSVIVLIASIAFFYHLGAEANRSSDQGGDIAEEIDNQRDAFSRSRAANNNPLRTKTTIDPIPAPVPKAKPMASSIPTDGDPNEDLSPLSDY